MISEAMPPSNTPLGLLFNILTFCIGTIFSMSQIPQSAMAKITLQGSSEVVFYGVLGGLASLITKLAAEQAVKRLFRSSKPNQAEK